MTTYLNILQLGNIIVYFLCLVVLVCIVSMIVTFFLFKRSHEVLRFRLHVIDLCGAYNKKHNVISSPSNNNFFNAFDLFESLPKHEEMVFSNKPLKLETYLTEEQINKLLN